MSEPFPCGLCHCLPCKCKNRDLLYTQWLQIELDNGNDGRGYSHWRTTKNRELMEATLRSLGLIRKPFDEPVRLEVVRVLGKRQSFWDADSVLRGNAKELIDSMVACGWFHDDGYKWITDVRGKQDASQRDEGPAVEVFIYRSQVHANTKRPKRNQLREVLKRSED